MSIQLPDVIYSDACNTIINYLNFEDIITLRCVSKRMHESHYPEEVLALILEKGGTQNLSRIEPIFHHLTTFTQTVQRVFKDIFNKKLSWIIKEQKYLNNYYSIARNFFSEAEVIEIENKTENNDVNQIIEIFKNLKVATINAYTHSILRIHNHPTIQELTIKNPKLQYAPEFYRCPQLKKVHITNCLLNEPPQIRECPKVEDVNYQMRPPEHFPFLPMCDF